MTGHGFRGDARTVGSGARYGLAALVGVGEIAGREGVGRRMLESGEAQSMREIARREGVDGSYVARLVGLTLQAPWVVEELLG